MNYRYLVTETLREKLAKANLSPRMLRELRSLEESEEKLNADLLHSTKIVLERRNRPGGERIIWFEDKRQEGLCLYVLRDVYLHDEYKKELRSKEGARKWQENHLYDELEELEIEDKIKEYLTKGTKKEKLPEEWYPYENYVRSFDHDNIDDVVIYESKEWIDDFFEVKDNTIQKIILRDLSDLISKQNVSDLEIWTKVQDVTGIDSFRKLVEGDIQIVFRFEAINDRLVNVFLLSISKDPDYACLKNMNYHSVDYKLLKKRMKRCYPGYFLLDEGLSESEVRELELKGKEVTKEDKLPLWLQVEHDKDGQANLILSNEEIELLEKVKYPFFINGLAGSGKSTLLYYLFACIYAYQHKKYPEHSLLFLSYSERLVTQARKFVASILRLNKQFMDTQNIYIAEDMEDFIKPFRAYLRSIFLTEDERNGLFANQNYIDYNRFKEKYYNQCRLDEKNKITPDVVWSVIRVFIKGYKSEGILSERDYSLMYDSEGAKKDLTLDKKMYHLSYIIWDKWYRKEFDEKRGWDDLDLVKYILNNKRINRQYAAVFCDEAQDFTRVETELIIKLSKYSLYDLSEMGGDVEAPIAFAGDPNQTINPTGFRIGSIKQLFTDVFRDLVGIDGYSFKEEPLEINYRSREGIVNFANSIQFIRYKLIGQNKNNKNNSSCNFQYAWDNEGTQRRKNKLDGFNYVSFYSLDKHPDLHENLGKALSILTSEDGEYYVTADDKSSEEEKIASEETKERLQKIALPLDKVCQNNVYTAVTAKGLEFKSSILYRFASIPVANDAINAFNKGIVEGNQLNDSESFALAHFMTKLYVSISRAKEVLFILDTDEAYNRFWKYLSEPEFWTRYIRRDYNVSDEKYSFGLMLHDHDKDLIDYSHLLDENFDPKREAERLFKEAKQEHSAQNMRRARDYFSSFHNEEMILQCDAYYALYSGKGREAGDMFVSMDAIDEAANAYWESMCWQELLSIPSTGGMQRLVSQYMNNSLGIRQFLLDWKQYRDVIYQNVNNYDNENNEKIWNVIIRKILDGVKSLQAKDISDMIIDSFESFADVIPFSNEKYNILAGMHFKRAQHLNQGRDFESPNIDTPHYMRAIESWDQANSTDQKDYYTSKLFVSKTASDRICWMRRLLMNEEILRRYSDVAIANSLNEEAASIIFSCLLNSDFSKAVAYPYPKDTQTKWNRLYSQNPKRFLMDVVLDNFTPEKFYFIVDKVQIEEHSIFDDKLPSGIFDIIFSLREVDGNGQPYWSYFTSKLKNEHAERVFKNSTIRPKVLESLSKEIESSKEYDKSLASCFLEFLFDSDFNVKQAEKFNSTLIAIIGHDVFFKEDFRRITERNKYFTAYSELNNEEHDIIKNNVRRYVEYFITKKASSTKSNEIKTLLRAYEICAPYQGTSPDYLNICNMYKKCLKEKELSSIKEWLEQRLLFNQFMDDYMLQKASFSKLDKSFKDKSYDIHSFVEGFTKEDASMFVSAVNTCDEEPTYESTFLSSKLIYKHHLRRDNLKPFCRVNDLIAKLPDAIDTAINEVLANKDHVNEYAIRILTYTWEALYEHTFVANHYDKLKDNKRLARLMILTEYLKKRALLHYSYLKQALFEDKQEEYGISIRKDYLPAAYPRIEERGADKDSSEKKISVKKDVKTTCITGTTTSVEKQKKNQRGRKKPESTVILNPLDAAKMAQLEMAKNLKKMGFPVETICQAAPLLTIEEIMKL